MTWCTVWKGKPQDYIDHMRRVHDTPPLVKAANLTRWFSPWTVSREQSSLTQSAVSGIAVDILLFSRIGVPLFHRYRVFDQPGTHVAFRGTYMQRMRTFLEESDDESLRARHRRRAREMAAQMSRTTLQDTGSRAPDISSRPRTYRRNGSRARKSTPLAAVAATSVAPGVVHSNRSNPRAVPALMDLALPRFASPEGRSARPHLPWIVMTDSPASPAPVRLTAPLRPPSPCLHLDALSSNESAGPGDVWAAPICILDASSSPVNPEQVLSDDDLPTAMRAEDRQQVIRICDVPPEVQVVDLSQDDQICDTRLAMWGAGPPPGVPGDDSQQTVRFVDLPPEARISAIPPGVGVVDLTPVTRAVDVPAVGCMETVPPTTSPDSVQMSPDSPPTVAFEDLSVSSVPMSLIVCGLRTIRMFRRKDPCLRYCRIYTMPSGLTFLPGQSSVQTVMALAVSSGPEGWSSGMPQTFDVSREGPFDAYSSPMDTGDNPLVTTGSRRYKSGVWHAASSPPVSGVYRGAGVGSAVVSFPGVLDTTFGRGGCAGGGGRSTAGRRYHLIEPSDSFAVCNVTA